MHSHCIRHVQGHPHERCLFLMPEQGLALQFFATNCKHFRCALQWGCAGSKYYLDFDFYNFAQLLIAFKCCLLDERNLLYK